VEAECGAGEMFETFFLLCVVFLSSQLASQVLVRSRRANQMFEEMKPGELHLLLMSNKCWSAVRF